MKLKLSKFYFILYPEYFKIAMKSSTVKLVEDRKSLSRTYFVFCLILLIFFFVGFFSLRFNGIKYLSFENVYLNRNLWNI